MFARRPHSLTNPSGLRSFSALLAQLARSVCGTTCDGHRRCLRRQLLCRIFARSIVHQLAFVLHSTTSLPHLATPDVANAVAHSCSTLGVANGGNTSYTPCDYSRAFGSNGVADVGIFVHHIWHSTCGSKRRGLPADRTEGAPSATLL